MRVINIFRYLLVIVVVVGLVEKWKVAEPVAELRGAPPVIGEVRHGTTIRGK